MRAAARGSSSAEREEIKKLRKENAELRRVERDPQISVAVFRARARLRPSEVTRYIDEHRARFGVEPICRTLGVSASAYYQRATGGRSARVVEDERLLERIQELHEANYLAYGYRRMWKALHRAGERVGRCRVQRLMAANGIVGAKRRGKPWRTTKPDPAATRPNDLVGVTSPRMPRIALWVGDFTYLRCWEGIVYFSFVIDVFSRMVVGWQLAAQHAHHLVLDALRMAIGIREPGADFQLICHTDAGSQYTSFDYTQVLDDHRVLRSIGSVGDAYDNAMAESFVDTFKTELIADRVWRTRSSSSSRSSSTSAGSTTGACTRASVTSRRSNTNSSTPASTARFRRTGAVAGLSPSGSDGLTERPFEMVGAEIAVEHASRLRDRLGRRSVARSGRATGDPMMEAHARGLSDR